MGFREQGVKLHRSWSETLSGKTWESNSRESLGLPCPAPPRHRAPAASEMRDTRKGTARVRDTGEMFCGKRCLSVSTPTRNPQGFGPFSPSAGTKWPLQRGRTALARGAGGDWAWRMPLLG